VEATSISKKNAKSCRSRVGWTATGVVAAGCAAVLLWALWPPPQIGSDPEVFSTVDALFTAITSKNEHRLADCEQRLGRYREDDCPAPPRVSSMGLFAPLALENGKQPPKTFTPL